MKNNTLNSFKKASIFFTLLILSFNQSKACSPLNVPTLNSQAIVGNFLNLTWSSNTTYNCTYSVQVEIACSASKFNGIAPFYVNAGVTKTSTTPFAYPGTQAIDISTLCPGTTYFFRAREVYGTATFSSWTSNFSFTTPGTFIPPTGNIIATPPVILACPQGNSVLSFSCMNCCGVPPYSYTWAPGATLSCTNCPSPTATPTVTPFIL